MLVAMLDVMLEFTVEKKSKLIIIYTKQTFIAIKTHFTHKNLKYIFLHEKNKQ